MNIFKKIYRSKVARILFWILITVILCVAICAISFITKCSSVGKDFIPVKDRITTEQKALEATIPDYKRNQETSYVTFSEWYLVFNPQEYAEFIDKNPPSHFPYFGSIGQFWGGYCHMYGITKNHFKFNSSDHVVEAVIGSSFTVEYIIKGIYENTIGRISELSALGQKTDEDAYATEVARDYGKFIPDYPWYEFPFAKRLGGLWTKTSFFGPHLLRKFERKSFLSLEYGVKAGYAALILQATHAAFGIAATEVYVSASQVQPAIFNDPKVKKIEDLGDGNYIMTVPHYQGFTDTVPVLAEKGVQFNDLAGNNEILMTAIAPSDWQYAPNIKEGSLIFEMPILTSPELKRIALQVPVYALTDTINTLLRMNVTLEHLYDY